MISLQPHIGYMPWCRCLPTTTTIKTTLEKNHTVFILVFVWSSSSSSSLLCCSSSSSLLCVVRRRHYCRGRAFSNSVRELQISGHTLNTFPCFDLSFAKWMANLGNICTIYTYTHNYNDSLAEDDPARSPFFFLLHFYYFCRSLSFSFALLFSFFSCGCGSFWLKQHHWL